MIVIEKDFKIEQTKDYFILSFLKTKQELKKDSGESYKLGGYYRHIENAVKAVQDWRLHKKYPFMESPITLAADLINFYKAKKLLREHTKKLKEVRINFKLYVYEQANMVHK